MLPPSTLIPKSTMFYSSYVAQFPSLSPSQFMALSEADKCPHTEMFSQSEFKTCLPPQQCTAGDQKQKILNCEWIHGARRKNQHKKHGTITCLSRDADWGVNYKSHFCLKSYFHMGFAVILKILSPKPLLICSSLTAHCRVNESLNDSRWVKSHPGLPSTQSNADF